MATVLITARVAPRVYRKLKELKEKGRISSISQAVNIALENYWMKS